MKRVVFLLLLLHSGMVEPSLSFLMRESLAPGARSAERLSQIERFRHWARESLESVNKLSDHFEKLAMVPLDKRNQQYQTFVDTLMTTITTLDSLTTVYKINSPEWLAAVHPLRNPLEVLGLSLEGSFKRIFLTVDSSEAEDAYKSISEAIGTLQWCLTRYSNFQEFVYIEIDSVSKKFVA